MKQIKLINIENVPEEEAGKYSVRKCARAVVFDDDGLVALLHATKTNYYNLPGGGIKRGETKEQALRRECKEEIGCDVEIAKELGLTIEYRKKSHRKHLSYWYIAKVVGEKGEPTFEDYEIREGFKIVWFPIENCIKKISECRPTIYEVKYMIPRDLALLEIVKKIIG